MITGYLLSAAVATPIGGRLGDMFGKRRVLVVVLTAVAAGCVVSGLASSLGVLVAGRVVQGTAGAVFPLSFGIARDEIPPERSSAAIALVSAIMGVGGGLGIVLACPITEHLSWHWLFWFPLMLTGLCLVAALTVVPASRVRTPGRVNWLSAGLLSAALVALLLGISEGPTWQWGSARVIGLLAGSAVLLAAWVLVELRVAPPLVDMKMMRLPAVWTTNSAALLLAFGMFGMFILIPEMVELPRMDGFGFAGSITTAGLYLLPARRRAAPPAATEAADDEPTFAR